MQKVDGSSPFIRLGFPVSRVPLSCHKRRRGVLLREHEWRMREGLV